MRSEMTCAQICELINEWLDGELDAVSAQAIEKHMEGCPPCRALADEFGRVQQAVAALGEVEMPEDFQAKLHAKLVDAKKQRPRKLRWGQMGAVAAGILVLATLGLGLPSLLTDGSYKLATDQLPAPGAGYEGKSNLDNSLYTDFTANSLRPQESLGGLSPAPTQLTLNDDDSATGYSQDAKIIKTAALAMRTQTFDEDKAFVTETVESIDGYFQQTNLSGSPEQAQRRFYAVIRIPSQNLEPVLLEVSALNDSVSVATQQEDVSIQYHDVNLRLSTLKTQYTRLDQLLAKAESTSDLLAIESELQRVQYEIESATTSLRGWDQQVDYATVTLEMQEVPLSTPVGEETFWQRLGRAFADGADRIVYSLEQIAFFVTANIIWVGGVALVVTVVWVSARRRRRVAAE